MGDMGIRDKSPHCWTQSPDYPWNCAVGSNLPTSELEKLYTVKVLILGVAYTQPQMRDRLKFRVPHYQRPLRRMETVKIPSWVIWFHWLNKHKPSLSLPSILAHFFQGFLEDSRDVTMGHWVKMLAAQSADRSSIPEAHSWKKGFLLTPVCP